MKNVGIELEGLPQVKMNKNQVIMDQVTIEVNVYDFLVNTVKAYHEHVASTEGTENAYKAVIEAMSEGVGVEILEELESKIATLEEDLKDAKELIQDMIEG